jgi:CRISPR-associated protein Csm2
MDLRGSTTRDNNRGNNFHQGNRNYEPFTFEKHKITDWIKLGIIKDCIAFADEFGKKIKDGGLTTSQIRNVFGEMRRIQMYGYDNQKTSFILLKPKLAYAVKRNENNGLKDFFKFFDIAYKSVDSKDHFKNMMDLTEAVLAYHKFHGGKE